jgi:hypothetical protein
MAHTKGVVPTERAMVGMRIGKYWTIIPYLLPNTTASSEAWFLQNMLWFGEKIKE